MRFLRFLVLVTMLTACIPIQNQTSPTATAPSTTVQPSPDGAVLFQQSCAGCHQGTGLGIEGVFPPLAKHVPVILKADGGREYLARVLLFGLQGPIQAQGKTYSGRMPGFGGLEDNQLAALLNHLSRSWGNAELLPSSFRPYNVTDIATLRANPLTVNQLLEQRSKLSPQP
jgi:mono/diheme cytochrome c family protein